MVIDPRLYEKLSGRKGDPYDRLGQALAQNDQRKAERASEMHQLKMAGAMPGRWRMMFLYPKETAIAIVVIALVVLAIRLFA